MSSARSARRETWSPGAITLTCLCAISVILMVVGSLGPWVVTPVLSVAGWSGWGFPLLLCGLAEVGLMMGFVLHRHRAWIIAVVVLAISTFVVGLFFWMIVGAVLGTASTAADIFARGSDPAAFADGVSVGWGIKILVISSLACAGLGIAAAIKTPRRSLLQRETSAGSPPAISGVVPPVTVDDDSLDY